MSTWAAFLGTLACGFLAGAVTSLWVVAAMMRHTADEEKHMPHLTATTFCDAPRCSGHTTVTSGPAGHHLTMTNDTASPLAWSSDTTRSTP